MIRMGIEEEFHIIDPRTRYAVSAAPALLEKLPSGPFTGEMVETSVELNTAPHDSLPSLRTDLVGLRTRLVAAAGELGLGVIASGTAPLMRLGDVRLGPGEHYALIMRKYAEVAREWVTCGLHVHVEVVDRDDAVLAMNSVLPHLGTLLAISASSPYWIGRETGLASYRHTNMMRLPTAHVSGPFASADEYDELVDTLLDLDIMANEKMFYPPIRLSSHLPTIELRVGDSIADAEVSLLIAALFRALVGKTVLGTAEIAPTLSPVAHDAAMGLAAREGLAGDLVDPVAGVVAPAHVVLRRLVDFVTPELVHLGDLETVTATVEHLLEHGNSASRQRRQGELDGLEAVTDQLLAETRACTEPATKTR